MKFFSLVNDVEYISTRIFQLAFLSSDMISTYDLKNTTISVYVFEEFDPKKKWTNLWHFYRREKNEIPEKYLSKVISSR